MTNCRTTMLSGLLGSVSLVSLLASAPASFANPLGGSVEAGSATISQPDANTLQVDQQTPRAIINWNSFNVDEGNVARFVLPNAQSVTLNRDLGGNLSAIQGSIESNGQFFLVNPNGILFGPNSKVDVAGLVATTHDIRSEDFMLGNYEFSIEGKPNASVVNQGQVSVQALGFGAFVAPHVRNEGSVVARMGRIELASASGFTLDMHGDRLISFLVENPNEHEMYQPNGEPVTALVENTGELIADGGVVAMSAAAARGVIDSVINTDGIIQANTVEQRGGKIILGGGGAGAVRAAGQVNGVGSDVGQQGGRIEITGETVVASAGANIDASGQSGGGTVLFGGDYLGGKTTNDEIWHLGITLEDQDIPTSRIAFVDESARIAVDATGLGDGGKLIVWSDEATFSYGHLSARGGEEGGNGGFIETSGAYIDVSDDIDASAVNGQAGTWLIDPLDITIQRTNERRFTSFSELWQYEIAINDVSAREAEVFSPTAAGSIVSAGTIETALNAGTNVVVTTYQTEGDDQGNIYLNTFINKESGGRATLGLFANNDIVIGANNSIVSSGGILNLELKARNGMISAQDMGLVFLNGGYLSLTAEKGINLETISDAPELLFIRVDNNDLDQDFFNTFVKFDDDQIDFDYNINIAEFGPSAIQLTDETATGGLIVSFDEAVEWRLSNLSIVNPSYREWEVNGTTSIGVRDTDAFDDIAEIVGGAELFYGSEPTNGFTPVVEISDNTNSVVDYYIPTSPLGDDLLEDFLEINESSPETPPINVPVDSVPSPSPVAPPVLPVTGNPPVLGLAQLGTTFGQVIEQSFSGPQTTHSIALSNLIDLNQQPNEFEGPAQDFALNFPKVATLLLEKFGEEVAEAIIDEMLKYDPNALLALSLDKSFLEAISALDTKTITQGVAVGIVSKFIAGAALDLYADATGVDVNTELSLDLAQAVFPLAKAAAAKAAAAKAAATGATTGGLSVGLSGAFVVFKYSRRAALTPRAENELFAAVSLELKHADNMRQIAKRLEDSGRQREANDWRLLANQTIEGAAADSVSIFRPGAGEAAERLVLGMDEVIQLMRAGNRAEATELFWELNEFAKENAPGPLSLTTQELYSRFLMVGPESRGGSVRAFEQLNVVMNEILED